MFSTFSYSPLLGDNAIVCSCFLNHLPMRNFTVILANSFEALCYAMDNRTDSGETIHTSGIDLRDRDLSCMCFYNIEFYRANFSGSNVCDVTFEHCDMTRANFLGCILSTDDTDNVSFYKCNMSFSRFNSDEASLHWFDNCTAYEHGYVQTF